MSRFWYCGLAAAALLIACGGSDRTPSSPTPAVQPPPSPPPPPSDAWTLEGRVVATVGGAPIANARVKPEIGTAVLTDGQGRFRLTGTTDPGRSPYRVTVSAAGHVRRETWLTWRRGERANVTIDLIAQTAPFSLTMFRQLARGAFENEGNLEPLRPWTRAPSFYIRIVDENGRSLSGVPGSMPSTLRSAVRQLTGGRFAVAAIETGRATRAERAGWINVTIMRQLEENTCALTSQGDDPGSIVMRYRCYSCQDVPSAILGHLVGHALGFYDVSDRESMMYWPPDDRCDPFQLTEQELHHAAIAYSRPRGNTDPDRDPASGALVRPGRITH